MWHQILNFFFPSISVVPMAFQYNFLIDPFSLTGWEGKSMFFLPIWHPNTWLLAPSLPRTIFHFRNINSKLWRQVIKIRNMFLWRGVGHEILHAGLINVNHIWIGVSLCQHNYTFVKAWLPIKPHTSAWSEKKRLCDCVSLKPEGWCILKIP